MMDEQAVAAYVDAACVAMGMTLDAGERARVIGHFVRIGAMASPLLALQLADEVEMAPVFRA